MEVEAPSNYKVDQFFHLILGQVKKGNNKNFELTLRIKFKRGKQEEEK